ncbi:MAG: S8 family serine peptidase [Bryobacteraceae bacterium]
MRARQGASGAAVSAAISAQAASISDQIPQLNIRVLRLPNNAVEKISGALEKTGLFTFVERDGLAKATLTPNDSSFASQWHLAKVQATSAWNISQGNAQVGIAIVDSGVDGTHPDLAPKLIPGYNFLSGNTNTSDVLGHGTATAGTAAAATDNLTGVAGLAWKNSIMPLVVLSSSNYAYYSDIANAIIYAADHGIRVISISIGGTSSSSVLQAAVDYAWSKGAIVVASAGNTGNSIPNYPAACDKVIAVSATDASDNLPGWSSYGAWVDLAAPGDSILTTSMGGAYGYWSGTSFSAPLVSGLAALVLSANPALTNTSLVQLLQQNSDDLGTPGFDQYYGWGRINAFKALLAASSNAGDTTPPSVVISSPAPFATIPSAIQVQGTATDNMGVIRTELYVDGQLSTSGSASPFSFSFVPAAWPNGIHTLMVKAYDAAGNAGSASVSVSVWTATIQDVQPPVVSIQTPANFAQVSGAVSIVANASDNNAVTQVTIYLDGVAVYTGTSAPYSYDWNTKKSSVAIHTIMAKAWDAAGNVAQSSDVKVSVLKSRSK